MCGVPHFCLVVLYDHGRVLVSCLLPAEPTRTIEQGPAVRLQSRLRGNLDGLCRATRCCNLCARDQKICAMTAAAAAASDTNTETLVHWSYTVEEWKVQYDIVAPRQRHALEVHLRPGVTHLHNTAANAHQTAPNTMV